MRITDRVLADTLTSNLASASERVYEKEKVVLSGKILQKPSDNPVDTTNSLLFRTRLSDIEQYQRNITQAQEYLNQTETVLSDLSGVIDNVNIAATAGASGSNSTGEQTSLTQQVNYYLEQMLTFANNSSNGVYLLAGTNNDQAPYQAIRNAAGEIVDVKTNGTGGDINNRIGENMSIKANINGQDVFEKDRNLFSTVIKIRDDLRADNAEGLRGDLMQLSASGENLISTQSLIGSRLNRLSAAEARAEKDAVNFKEYISNIEDADSSKAILDYQMELSALQSSQQAGARLLNQSLLDFLS
jgi:flagellar hook-associated protein 3 FlgL